MTITSLFGLESDDPKLKLFHDTRGNPKKVICTKDNPRSRSIEHHIFKKGELLGKEIILWFLFLRCVVFMIILILNWWMMKK